MKPLPSVSLIVATYNWKEALALNLESILGQKKLPNEVIVADDGSKEDTLLLIESYQKKFPIPLIHCWQPDEGFQLGKIRNRAIAQAKNEYIIQVDGDLILHPFFVQDHLKFAQKGFYTQGSRVILSEILSEQIRKGNSTPSSYLFFSKEIKNRHNTLHLPFLTLLLGKKKASISGTRGCNMAFWREDLLLVNGYNEEISGWGREDSELVVRLMNNNIYRRNLKFGAIAYHLFHPEADRSTLLRNDEILHKAIQQKTRTCTKGISNYL